MFVFQWVWFIVLLPLPLLLQRFWRYSPENTTQYPYIKLITLKRAQQAFNQSNKLSTSTNQRLRMRLLWLCWLGLVLALMQPQLIEKHVTIQQTGYDLLLAVDLSGSMDNADFFLPTGERINRLQAVKTVLKPFIEKRTGDRIGLILFANQAYLQAPLTLDNLAVADMLARAEIGMAGRDTAIGDAIGLAVKKLRERPAESRVLILLTDGDNNAGILEPQQAATLAKQYDIRVYTVGVGSQENATNSGFNAKSLQEIASSTQGKYYPASDLQALSKVYTDIDTTLHKTTAESRLYLQRTLLYQYPLGLAMLALFGLQGLRLRTE
ncbi:vWA domain-containing protein [Beggiatoa leptomitoformis]|uniref:VWA domain-containing protein n=1 Tax=Beggiatoa leptomitoformis TaxID=288004 RepID=A0A2N9YAZ8_9GAMM|nr:VWA domain-containing protein [Beggiatoa leptomitoformis]ALG66986.1 VWA domain-containing protein [Beggiatoa leptomitoformis]AUI67643.1 VWA domain-containing protein [Beggiatoa leptomitoformis]